MSDEHLYVVTYDIADERRWRGVFRLMHGYGEWMQLSVFQCRLSCTRHAELVERLTSMVCTSEDHVLVIDLGMAEHVEPRVQSIGKRGFSAVVHEPLIV